MCALKAVVNSLEGLSDEIRRQYKKGKGRLTGKYVLDVLPSEEMELADGGGSATTIAALQKALIREKGHAALERAGGSVPLLLPALVDRSQVEVTPEGQVRIGIVDENGRPRISPARGSTRQMSIEELVDELKQDPALAAAFGTQQGGQATRQGGGTTVRKGDHAAISANLEGIAAGTVEVVDE